MTNVETVLSHDPFSSPLEVDAPDLDHLSGGANISIVNGTSMTLEDLKYLPTPPATDTFVPIPHYDFVHNLQGPADKILHMSGYNLDDVRIYTQGENHERMFGALVYRKDREDLKLAVGFRQGLDKTMSAAVAVGGHVTICSNLMFYGKETLMRKHTKNIKQDLRAKILSVLWDVDSQWSDLQSDVDTMTGSDLSDDCAYRAFGLAYGRKIIAAQQMTKAVAEWRDPTYDHGDKTVWRWYNSITESYKGLAPAFVMRKHSNLHDFTMRNIVNN